jgi:CRP/FNR family transcriptional regulator, anaerobic regulatory protein
MADNNIISFPPLNATCANCRWSRFCVARALEPETRPQAAKNLVCSGPLRRGAHLFRQGDELKSLYIVRSGSVKAYIDNEDGCEQTVAFHFPGDLLGFDAIAGDMHQSSAVALETTAVCSIPYARLTAVASEVPALWNELMRSAATQLIAKQSHALLLGQKSAQARFATFLLFISNRFAARGCSRTEFNLSMSRQEIANYLAVAVETISRLFTDLQRRGVLEVDRRFVRILSLDALNELAHDGRSLGVSNA